MLDASTWREHLALERRSIPELVTAASVLAMAGATLYNFGFFAPIEWSLISLLTVQDLVIALTIALLPMVLAAWLALLLGKFIGWAPGQAAKVWMLGLPLMAASGLGFFYFFDGPWQSTAAHLTCGYFMLGGLAAILNLHLKAKLLPAVWLAFSILYIPFAVGITDSLAALGNSERAISVVKTDKEEFRGTVLRVTSAYVLLFDGASVVTVPMSRVLNVRRMFNQSPEVDFLVGTLQD